MILLLHGLSLEMADKYLELPEPSEIMRENARIKAAAAIKQCPEFDYALGDDSGICVRALSYFPGVHSRRWYGAPEDDDSRNEKLLELMENETDRTTYLISQFVLVNYDGDIVDCETVSNEFSLAYEINGNKGFGYDKVLIPSENMLKNLVMDGRNTLPLFDVFDFEKTTIGEMNQEQKNAITYRGRIARKIKEKLEGLENGNN